MKYTFRISIALSAFLFGITAFLFSSGLRIHYLQTSSVPESSEISPLKIEGKVYLRFGGCVGKRAVIILDNQTDRPIYARVQRADYLKDYKDADMEWGVHFIEYKAPDSQTVENSITMWDGHMPFKMIPPYSRVRYGVDLWKGQGEYKVTIPYMEDAEFARRLDEDFAPILTTQDYDRVMAAWKKVESDVITNSCQ